MGVPAFFRWLSEKYPKIVQDVLEERVKVVGGASNVPIPMDCTKPNPSGLECDNLYIDMNGIIHPCSHPEQGPQPKTEVEMYENVCAYVDRLFRVMRPRKLLYLAIDGVAPRAKMNQQRARRFRSAQEAREHMEVEDHVRNELQKLGQHVPPAKPAWDSNVITPGTPFMLNLSTYVRFYIRKRISTDPAWKQLRVIFSDASVPGEGEHKIMSHIRLQRNQPGYSPNVVHILHGLDADLIMLALATHEPHFYISREEVLFGRKSQEQNEQRQLESGFRDQQRQLDEEAGDTAMQLLENRQKPLVRISIPILREYLAADFACCLNTNRIPFPTSLERLLDDIVFLCFFVGNDFLPHLPSLDIRDGALDFLFNVYKRLLPTLSDYITNHGGQVNLSHVDVILAEVGAIEDYVFGMKRENELREEERRNQMKQRKKQSGGKSLEDPTNKANTIETKKVLGRAARILEKQKERALKTENSVKVKASTTTIRAKKQEDQQPITTNGGQIKVSHMKSQQNLNAAMALKQSLLGGNNIIKEENKANTEIKDGDGKSSKDEAKEKSDGDNSISKDNSEVIKDEDNKTESEKTDSKKRKLQEVSNGVGQVGDAEDEFDADDDDDNEDDLDKDDVKTSTPIISLDPDVAKAFKERVKEAQQKKLDEYSKNVEDKVRLHEAGWKDRYYSDKCKADDVAAHGGRDHLFRSYVMGLCWVMKYYYDGCPSWKWYYPFHYAPFASDLRNIERFASDCKSFELATPFNPVEQLMAVLPSDSKHAIPKASRWLMDDPESPILDFYPKDVPVDPNGKAMPWLWVVLLPFIEEERLLAALTPTMAKWTNEELLCNARGLDDGYVFVHLSHPLAAKFLSVLKNGKTAKSPKVRLNAGTCPGFTGSMRPPLSNEVYPLDEEDVTIKAPAVSSSKVIDQNEQDRNDATGVSTSNVLFSEDVHSNQSLCVAFTEPPKLSHKSILLPGTVVARPVLTAEDKRIRRPRLNRGGATIAMMGGGASNGQSFQSGYGSMNINSYERDLAQRTGRGNQMHQAGTRQWGAMEPTPKRPYQPSNPFSQQHGRMQQHQPHNRGNSPPPPHLQQNRPPWQQHQHQGGGQYHQSSQQQFPPYQQQQQQQYPQQRGQWQQQRQQQGQQGYNQGYQHGNQQQQHRQFQQGQGHRQQQPQQQRFDFRSFNQQPPNSLHQQNRGSQRQQPPPPPPPPPGRANANVMSSLKAQLASTLRQNRRPADKR